MRRSRYNKTLIKTNVSSLSLVVVVVVMVVVAEPEIVSAGCSAVEVSPTCLGSRRVAVRSILFELNECQAPVNCYSDNRVGSDSNYPGLVQANYLQKSPHIYWHVRFLSSYVNDCLIRSQFSRVIGSKCVFNDELQ